MSRRMIGGTVAVSAVLLTASFLTATNAEAATGTSNDPNNLSPNPILATSLTGYGISAGGTGLTRVSVTDHVAASWAARVTESATTTRIKEPQVSVTPGTTYTWASDVKAPSTSTVQITVSWYNSSGTFLSYASGAGVTGFSQTSWKRAVETFAPPTSAAIGEVVVNVLNGTKNALVYVTQHDVTPPVAPAPSPTPTPTPTPTATPTPTPTPTPTATPNTITVLPGQPGLVEYPDTGDPDLANVVNYAHPGALVIAGRTAYGDQVFKDVSAAGGTVLVYLDAMINASFGRYHDMLINQSVCGAAVPVWKANVNQWGSLNDIRVGGVLQGKLKCVLEAMVAENPHIGGFFADDLGSRSWFPNLNWSTMTATEQQQYRDGAIGLAQTFHDVAVEHGLMVMVNGTWGGGTLASNGGGYPDITKHGLSLADGGFIEHHASSELSYWSAYAQGQWGTAAGSASQGHPVMFVAASTDADRTAYNNTGLFAFLSTQTDYSYVAPWGSFHATGLPSHVAQ